MKRLSLLLMSSAVLFAQDLSNMRLLDAVNQVQKSIELAKRLEVDQKDPYHFEKAKMNRDVAYALASAMDEAGSRLFMVKSFNAISKAVSGKVELDQIDFITQEGKKARREYEEALGLDINSLNSGLKYARGNKALSCAPVELARAEVYYDAMAYELSRPQPDATKLVNLYKKAQAELDIAIQKVNIARERKLECYTREPSAPEPPRIETAPGLAKAETAPEPSKAEQVTSEPSRPQEEPLTVTARVHFDLGKHNIKREYIPLLNEVVKVLRENPNVRVRIEGFTDDIGSKAYNDKLALRRAQAVKDYLVRAGIPADRIDVVGFGKERYIAENTTPMGRFTNRRAEFIILQVPGQ